MHSVTIQPSGQQFQVEDGEAVLAAALRQGLVLPYGCKNGACGTCKGKIVSGTVDYGVYQPKALPDEDKARGKALFCQAKPLTDLVIEARTIGAVKGIEVKTLPCRVQKLERLADDVMALHLKLPANEKLVFLPGQYLEFLLKDGSRRSFSMAKMLTTIDALSRGRLICGVGVGWWKEEMTILGAPFHQRGRQADEILRVWKALWTSDRPRFKGEFYELDDIGFAPKPVQKPHPPIWVGGDSPGAFRRVATLGDGWHATSKSPQEMEKSLEGLRAAADAAARSMSSIELSVRVSLKQASLREEQQAIVDQLAGYKRLGLTHVVLDFRRATLTEMLDALDVLATEIRPAIDRG
jgi:probable F420-dependent oxidoreductase